MLIRSRSRGDSEHQDRGQQPERERPGGRQTRRREVAIPQHVARLCAGAAPLYRSFVLPPARGRGRHRAYRRVESLRRPAPLGSPTVCRTGPIDVHLWVMCAYLEMVHGPLHEGDPDLRRSRHHMRRIRVDHQCGCGGQSGGRPQGHSGGRAQGHSGGRTDGFAERRTLGVCRRVDGLAHVRSRLDGGGDGWTGSATPARRRGRPRLRPRRDRVLRPQAGAASRAPGRDRAPRAVRPAARRQLPNCSPAPARPSCIAQPRATAASAMRDTSNAIGASRDARRRASLAARPSRSHQGS
jgi:hypothetical protein